MKYHHPVIAAIFLLVIIAALIFPLENNSTINLYLGQEKSHIIFKAGQPLAEITQLLDLHGVHYVQENGSIAIENDMYLFSFDGADKLSRIAMHSFDGAGVILPRDYHDRETGYATLEKAVRLGKALIIATVISASYILYRKRVSTRGT